MTNTFEIIKEILVDKLSINPDLVKSDSSLTNDLGADSLDKVDIVIAVERKFGIIIPDDFEYNLVQDLVNFIDSKKKD